MNVFPELLRIKSFRESQAELRMHRQYDVTRQAHEKHESEQKRLTELLREGMETEDRLFGDLCQHVVRLRDIEDVRHAIADLRQREDRQQGVVSAAGEAKLQAEQALSEARAVHHEAHRQKTKFEDLSRDFDVAAARDAERRDDLEMEEAASVRHDREDWEPSDSEGGRV
ncbi:type III secretion system stalk subunit SctO [Ottowia thiooxydans]|uniref:type III secretion system stalk subunit SctO n=1 Tax=Ottowia thiooxydans TaxID=219182 RepID=UPI0004240936|nr:YscO family type III secretion system apparatus protein [Ottowia thiooxydans]